MSPSMPSNTKLLLSFIQSNEYYCLSHSIKGPTKLWFFNFCALQFLYPLVKNSEVHYRKTTSKTQFTFFDNTNVLSNKSERKDLGCLSHHDRPPIASCKSQMLWVDSFWLTAVLTVGKRLIIAALKMCVIRMNFLQDMFILCLIYYYELFSRELHGSVCYTNWSSGPFW